jgi:hypothetical protein
LGRSKLKKYIYIYIDIFWGNPMPPKARVAPPRFFVL